MKSITDTKPDMQTHSEIIENIVRKNTRLKQDISKIHEEHRQILEMKTVVQNVLDNATDAEMKGIRFASNKGTKNNTPTEDQNREQRQARR
jgi:hypothetical protein